METRSAHYWSTDFHFNFRKYFNLDTFFFDRPNPQLGRFAGKAWLNTRLDGMWAGPASRIFKLRSETHSLFDSITTAPIRASHIMKYTILFAVFETLKLAASASVREVVLNSLLKADFAHIP